MILLDGMTMSVAPVGKRRANPEALNPFDFLRLVATIPSSIKTLGVLPHDMRCSSRALAFRTLTDGHQSGLRCAERDGLERRAARSGGAIPLRRKAGARPHDIGERFANMRREANDGAVVEKHAVGFTSRAGEDSRNRAAYAHVALGPRTRYGRWRRRVDDRATGVAVGDAPGADLASRAILKTHAVMEIASP